MDCVKVRELLKRAVVHDIIQVDVEEFDDQGIVLSNIKDFLPPLVKFECESLLHQIALRLGAIFHLESMYFSQHRIGCLAIRNFMAS